MAPALDLPLERISLGVDRTMVGFEPPARRVVRRLRGTPWLHRATPMFLHGFRA